MLNPLSQDDFRGAVKWVLVISGIAFLLQQFMGAMLVSWFGLTPAYVIDQYRVWQVVTYAFLHDGLFQWLFNMFIFWSFGSHLERQWGTPFFVRFLLVSTIGAALCAIGMGPHSYNLVIGSSSAVFALLIVFAITNPHAVMYVFLVIPMKAWQACALFGIIEMVAVAHGGQAGTNGLAHLGGMAFGYLYFRFGREFEAKVSDFSTTLRSVSTRKSPHLEEVTNDLISEVDRILDKVSNQGSDALSAKEKQILERYTKTRH